MCRFARALKTAHEHDCRRLGSKIELLVRAAHESDKLFIDDFDNLLCGEEAFKHLAADCAFADLCDEVLDDFEVDVRLKQRELDLAHSGFDVCLRQLALVFEGLERLCHFFG